MSRINRTLKILYLYTGIFTFAGNLLGPLYALYVEGIQKGVLPICVSWAVFIMSSSIFTFFVSLVGDKVKRTENLLVIGILIRGVVWFLYGVITTFPQLIILQIIFGLGDALGSPAFDCLLSEHLDRGKRVLDYSSWRVVMDVAVILSVLVGGFIVNTFGFKLLFTSMLLLSVISAVGICFGLPERPLQT